MNDIYSEALSKWHDYVKSGDESILNALLGEDVIFYSPVVFSPQKGKPLCFLYLKAATQVFSEGRFTYKRQIRENENILLEFEAEVEGMIINGIDLIQFSPEGLIEEFKVMVRPLSAVNFIHSKMREMLENLMS